MSSAIISAKIRSGLADYSTAQTDYAVASPLDSGTQATSAIAGAGRALGFTRTAAQKFSHVSDADFHRSCAHHNPAPLSPQSRPNRGRECLRDATQVSRKSDEGMGMTEREKRLAREREEIATRIARFKATQQKFEREREEYFVTTLRSAREGKPIHSWS
jgi:hypothetical protein